MFDELFLLPFLTGLAFAVLLPVLGCYLRLRDEWLAALAYAHVAAAGALLALVAGLPPLAGGLGLAGMVGAGKQVLARRLNAGAGYASLLLGGWAISVLLAANQPMAERLGHALFDGQLYFSDAKQLVTAVLALILSLVILARLSRHLLLAKVYPDLFRLRRLPGRLIHGGFDVLAALALALATMSLGVMGAFALVFVPPWLAFRRAGNWWSGLRWAVMIGLFAYLVAFALALLFDQPFGPVLALILVLLGITIA